MNPDMKKPANQSISIDISSKSCTDDEVELWIDALDKLKEQKVDEVAGKTTFESCKYCKFPHTAKFLEPSELDEIRKLNLWKPCSKRSNEREAYREALKERARLRALQANREGDPAVVRPGSIEGEENEGESVRRISKRDNYNYPPRALSLLGIDVEEFLKKPPSEQMKILRQKRNEMEYAKYGTFKRDFSPMCVAKLKTEIQMIQEGDYTSEERNNMINDLLNLLETKKCFKEGKTTHCDCLVRKLDIPKIRELSVISVFIKELIMDHVNKALDEKFALRLGLGIGVEDESIQISDIEIALQKSKAIVRCPDITCECGHRNTF